MSNPLIQAFFIGRALAETVSENMEATFTDALSELGKFDAEQRERLRQFTEQVLERAQREESAAMNERASSPSSSSTTEDLQAMIDELRAEVARSRAELRRYRDRAI
ncbi:MAG: hypothetical protein SFW36_23080 [Leptolyngbyaceae cyanobacterium bins.59]|nr:hypothetical protein [Leptolyngbyaceae cyanobacterium bins.59]